MAVVKVFVVVIVKEADVLIVAVAPEFICYCHVL